MTIFATFIIIIIIITNSIISVVVPKLRVKNVASDVAGSPAVSLRHNVRAGMRIICIILVRNARKIMKKMNCVFFNCFDIVKNSPLTYFVRS